jgi:hypothetical protein
LLRKPDIGDPNLLSQALQRLRPNKIVKLLPCQIEWHDRLANFFPDGAHAATVAALFSSLEFNGITQRLNDTPKGLSHAF